MSAGARVDQLGHQGDRLARFLVENAQPLHRYAFLLTGDRSDAEDLVQEAMLRALSAGEGLQDASQLGAYVKRILFNTYLNGQRRAAVHRRVLPRLLVRDTARLDEVEGLRDEVWQALRRLPRRQCAAVVLRYYEDLSYDDVAQILDCPPSTARSLVLRALRKLRVEVTEQDR